MARALVDSLHGPFASGDYEDTYRERLMALIRRKAKGKKIEIPERSEPEPPDDLAAALQASLDGG